MPLAIAGPPIEKRVLVEVRFQQVPEQQQVRWPGDWERVRELLLGAEEPLVPEFLLVGWEPPERLRVPVLLLVAEELVVRLRERATGLSPGWRPLLKQQKEPVEDSQQVVPWGP